MRHEHTARSLDAYDALCGLALGDAWGREVRFVASSPGACVQQRCLPEGTLRYTDDTEMALAVMQVLLESQQVMSDRLASLFAERFMKDQTRGYGAIAYWLLHRLDLGQPWQEVSRQPYQGQGSKGNGAAMRVAPLGAFFWHEPERLTSQAIASAEITHAHPDGQAGAVAVAWAGALACSWREDKQIASQWWPRLLSEVPEGSTRDGIKTAATLGEVSAAEAGRVLGTGIQILSEDTVPLALWCAWRHLGDFESAMWEVIASVETWDADIDTLCAIVGGLIGASCGVAELPDSWLAHQESLDLSWMTSSQRRLFQATDGTRDT